MQNSQKNEENVTKKRNLSILAVQEEERQRIARDLHDTSLQTLAHLVHKLELCNMYMDKDVFQAKLELLSVRQSLKEVIQEIRNTIFDLRPMSFDDLGVKETFYRFIERENADKRFTITSDIEKVDFQNELVEMTLYRIVQECVSNAIKHSQGSVIDVTAKRKTENWYEVVVSDNGIGFSRREAEEKTDHFGLRIMKERVALLNGKIEIHTEKDAGTRVCIAFPLEEEEKGTGCSADNGGNDEY